MKRHEEAAPARHDDPVAALAKRITSIKIVAAAVIGLAALGFSSATLLGRYARASEVDKLREHVSDHDVDIAVMKDGLRRVEDDLHLIIDQSIETARRVGAPVLPAPHRR